MIKLPNVRSIWIIIQKLVFNAAIYSIWAERNRRLFKNESQIWENVASDIIKNVRLKLFNLKVKQSKAVTDVAASWDVCWKGI